MIVGAGIALALGILHLIYTFSGNKLTPRDSALQMRMAEVPPVITRQTDVESLCLFQRHPQFRAYPFRPCLWLFGRDAPRSPVQLPLSSRNRSRNAWRFAHHQQGLFFQQSLQERTRSNSLLYPQRRGSIGHRTLAVALKCLR